MKNDLYCIALQETKIHAKYMNIGLLRINSASCQFPAAEHRLKF